MDGQKNSGSQTGSMLNRELRTSDFETIFNLSPDLICTAAPSGEFLRVSPSCERILGYTQDEVIRMGWAHLVHPDDLEPTQSEVAKQMQGSDTVNFVNRYRCKDGSYKILEWQGRFAGKGVMYGMGRDITERRRLEVSLAEVCDEERERLRRDLHDSIGQQLAGLRFLVASLRRAVPESCRKALELVMKIDEVASDALSASRQIAEALEPLSSEPDALATALQDLATGVDSRYGVQCRLTLPQPMLGADYDTANQLFLIAQEAVMNSVKHAQADRIDISMSLQDHSAQLVIEDDGVGFSRKAKHAGMGLHIMQSRAKLINAALDIRTGNAGGTVVTCAWSTQAKS